MGLMDMSVLTCWLLAAAGTTAQHQLWLLSSCSSELFHFTFFTFSTQLKPHNTTKTITILVK